MNHTNGINKDMQIIRQLHKTTPGSFLGATRLVSSSVSLLRLTIYPEEVNCGAENGHPCPLIEVCLVGLLSVVTQYPSLT